jgi:hypothetical protein
MYKIYYLTSDEDFNIPMYIGMTKLSLEDRLKNHLSHLKRASRKNLWFKTINKKVSIHLMQDSINSFKECTEIELFWINFWEKINPEIKNSIKYKLAEHPYKNSMENIRRNISQGVRKAKCRTILVFSKNMDLIGEFETIKSASISINTKEEIISKNLKDITKAKKYIFIYKDSYDSKKDYSYKLYFEKNRKKPNTPPKVSEKCRISRMKYISIQNLKTGEIYSFKSQTDASKFINCSNASISRCVKDNKLILDTYQILQ